jgi:predicted nucleic acid-binding protein
MAALETVPDGTSILIDANIFIYALSKRSEQCKRFLTRCSREQVFGITLHEVVHEANHEFMCAEAIAKGLTARSPAKYLSEHPDKVKTLTEYWVNTKKILALNLALLPMEEKIIEGAQKERDTVGLLTNDSLIVSAMREYAISHIATNDGSFFSVAGLVVFSPTDLA